MCSSRGFKSNELASGKQRIHLRVNALITLSGRTKQKVTYEEGDDHCGVVTGSDADYGFASNSDELDKLEHAISHYLQTKLPGWQHKRVEPIKGSKGVLIESWSFTNMGAQVSIVPKKSVGEAQQRLRDFAKDTREAKQVRGLGDGGYTWGYADSNLVFRKRRYIFWVSSGVSEDADPDFLLLSPTERTERQNSKVRRLNEEFARHLAAAIDSIDD